MTISIVLDPAFRFDGIDTALRALGLSTADRFAATMPSTRSPRTWHDRTDVGPKRIRNASGARRGPDARKPVAQVRDGLFDFSSGGWI